MNAVCEGDGIGKEKRGRIKRVLLDRLECSYSMDPRIEEGWALS